MELFEGKKRIKTEKRINVQWRAKKMRRQEVIRTVRMKCYTKGEENREG
jgi:hypothetical protein